MPGFSHRLHTKDPRTARLFELARESGVGGMHMQATRAVEKAFAAAKKSLPINVDGAIGAILADLGMNPAPSTAFFMIARPPGLVAHVIEEAESNRVKYWEIVADNLKKRGWSLGLCLGGGFQRADVLD